MLDPENDYPYTGDTTTREELQRQLLEKFLTRALPTESSDPKLHNQSPFDQRPSHIPEATPDADEFLNNLLK